MADKLLYKSVIFKIGQNGIVKINYNEECFKGLKYCLYFIQSGQQIIRVGESGSGLKRVIQGFKQAYKRINGKKNYYAYHWRKNYISKSLKVDMWELSEKEFIKPEIRRTLEAEVAYEIRNKTGKWPGNMTEIHFSEQYRKAPVVKKYLKSISKHYKLSK